MTINKAAEIVAEGLAELDLKGNRVLLIIPDTTRTAPVGMLVKTIHSTLKGIDAKLDIMVALGTHPPLSPKAMLQHLEMTEDEYRMNYSDMRLFNHSWDNPSSLMSIGKLTSEFIEKATNGILKEDVDITINRMIKDYDHLLILGPVFPHEVAGFSGGSKYLFPGISGPEIIDFFHWLGALITNLKTNGQADNPVRHVLDKAAKLVSVPVSAISLVVHNGELAGIYIGSTKESWQKAVELSAKLHIVLKPRPFKKVIACVPVMYDDLWTGGKGMYKCEPVVGDGGELILYAPHITSLSHTHGHLLEKIGYHVRDYYLADMNSFKDIPRAAMAISTYLRGDGTFENGIEKPRIQVTLATGITPQMCNKVGLGYLDPDSLDISQFREREDESTLLVERAGETLFLLESNQEAVT